MEVKKGGAFLVWPEKRKDQTQQKNDGNKKVSAYPP